MIVLLGETKAELGGSEFQYAVHGVTEGRPPQIDLDVGEALQDAVLEAIRQGLVASAHDLSEGGLAVALAECCFGRGLGAVVDVETIAARRMSRCSARSQSRMLLSVQPEKADALVALLARSKGVAGCGARHGSAATDLVVQGERDETASSAGRRNCRRSGRMRSHV